MPSLPIVIVSVVVFIVGTAGSALLFKLASMHEFLSGPWIRYFIYGNVVGFLCPVSLVIALKETHPNLIFAVCWGGGFVLLQIGAWWFFRQPLSVWQWSGIALVGVGILLLQFRG